jgi:aryl-alcohol dehydrogenase
VCTWRRLSGFGDGRVKATVAVARAGGVELAAAEVGEAREDEVLVRMVAAGVCHTDLVAGRRAGPMVLGHEGAGVVEAVGAAVGSVQPGDHVVLSYAWCGECANCADGRMAYCADFLTLNYSGFRADGSSVIRVAGEPVGGHFFGQSSWATHSVTSERNVVRVPSVLPLEHLAPLGCGVQTGAGVVLNVLGPARSIAVFGCGGVGLSAVMAARIAGYERIVAVDPLPARRDLALQLGATEAMPDGSGLRGLAHSVDCVGLPEVVRQAVGCLAAPGTCVTVGFRGGRNPVELDQRLLMGGRGIRGSIEGDAIPQRFIPDLVEHFTAGRLPVDRLVRTYAFAQVGAAISAMEEGLVVKPVLIF